MPWIDERGLSENAESALRAIWAGAGRPVTADPIWDEMFKFDPDGGPSLARMYSELSAALNELQGKLDGTGLVVIRQGREGWRFGLVEGGAYLAA